MRNQALRKTVIRYLSTDNRGHAKAKKHRAFVLHKVIDDLFLVDHLPAAWKHLKPVHIEKLVQHWKKQKLKPATIMRYMTVVRVFLNEMGCPLSGIDNQSLNLSRHYSQPKRRKVSADIWQHIDEPIPHFILALQVQFGLTFGEAIRFVPDIHVQEEGLWITREIAFNSEDRNIPLRHDEQKSLLEAIIQHTKGHRSLLQQHGAEAIRYHWHTALAKQKLSSNKSYRFLYAQALQKALVSTLGNYRTSWVIRDEMGVKSRNTVWLYLHE